MKEKEKMRNKQTQMKSANQKDIFEKRGKPEKPEPQISKEKSKQPVTEKEFLEAFGESIKITAKNDGYETVIKAKVNGKDKVIAWSNERKYGVGVSLFPPVTSDKWLTVKITNKKELIDTIRLITEKVKAYKPKPEVIHSE